MTLTPELEKVVDDLFYVGTRGVSEISVVWATVLELQCSRCKVQERWRGRTPLAVANVARLRGWVFDKHDALCPQHSSKKPSQRSAQAKYIRPGICTTVKCNEPVVPTPEGFWGRPITQCIKHYEKKKQYRKKYLAKKARLATLTPTIPPCNVSPDTQ